MRIVAGQLKDIVSAVKKAKEDVLFADIIKDCLEAAMDGKEYVYCDIDIVKAGRKNIENVVERLKEYGYVVEAKFYDEDGYVDITVRW